MSGLPRTTEPKFKRVGVFIYNRRSHKERLRIGTADNTKGVSHDIRFDVDFALLYSTGCVTSESIALFMDLESKVHGLKLHHPVWIEKLEGDPASWTAREMWSVPAASASLVKSSGLGTQVCQVPHVVMVALMTMLGGGKVHLDLADIGLAQAKINNGGGVVQMEFAAGSPFGYAIELVEGQ